MSRSEASNPSWSVLVLILNTKEYGIRFNHNKSKTVIKTTDNDVLFDEVLDHEGSI